MDEIEKAAASLDHPQTWFSIHQYLSYLKLETPLPDYMEKVQNQLSPIMREHMVNRLVEVAEWYQLLPETLHLSISYTDRILSSGAVPKNKLMILGFDGLQLSAVHTLDDCCFGHFLGKIHVVHRSASLGELRQNH
ncbi:hypothetical protein PVL29_003296 [Vitis rotundifolia]|uniref:Cyclin N-terminal domain-containing protein n=1 Tax=Vitis rotundifolia TaxID=103349 RepID=A0AA39ACU5_VITRO|nr:hypothetical protein PVL29_003296 [Vitis rotundifolia]